MIQTLASFALSVLLVLSSYGNGLARGSAGAIDQMVICAGSKAVLVYVDADGNPTQAPHVCPDCAMHGLDMLAVVLPHLGPAPGFSHHGLDLQGAVGPVLRFGGKMVRAPPALI